MSIDATRPLVSVIMANFNGGDHIASAVKSVLDQTLASLELIVSDDGSTDGGLERARAAAGGDPRLRILEGGSRTGPAAARNRAIRAARGEWIAIVDSDDFIHRERLERLVAAAERDGADIVADDLLVFYEDRSQPPHGFLRGPRAKGETWVCAADYVAANISWAGGATLGYLKPLIRRAKAADALFYDETLRIAEDFDLIARLLAAGARMRIYPELLYFYRKHSGSISHRLSGADLDAILAAHDRLSAQAGDDARLRRLLRRRRAELKTMRAFTALVEALKRRDWDAAAAVAVRRPSALWGLRVPMLDRLRRRKPRPRPVETAKRVAIISRQRVVSRTNGSSCYLLAIARSLRDAGYAVDFICASPKAFGRWPVLHLQPEIDVFSRYSVCGGVRTGRLVWATDPRVALRGAVGAAAWALGRLTGSMLAQPRPADYAVAARAERRDMIHVARQARPHTVAVLCDYAFLTPLAPFALAPDAPTVTLMHDLFSARVSDETIENVPREIASLSADEEFRLLSLADVAVAIQPEEGAQVRAKLPALETLVVPHATPCEPAAQPGEDDVVLFVGSNTASNAAGLAWFIEQCWPLVRAARPRAELIVAGSVGRAFVPRARGVRVLGVSPALDALYRRAGVVVAPLRTGSGLKIKLVEALGAGKAVVGAPISAQGVRAAVESAMIIRDDPRAFADAVSELLGDRQRRAALGEAALACARTHFASSACHDPLLRLIERGLPPRRTLASPAAARYTVAGGTAMTDTEGPHAAIVIAAYNAQDTIERAIRSALAQPEVAEVCVVDDASADATADVARACSADPRLHVIRQEKNAGPAAARNAAIAATSAPWVGILDADDYFLEGRLGALLAHADRADVIADVLLRDRAGEAAPAAAWSFEPEAVESIDLESFVRGNLTMANRGLELGFLKPLVRRSFLEQHGLRYRTDMRLGEDYELYARALALGARFVVTPPAGYVSVERAGSLSKDHSPEDLRRLRDCNEELMRLEPLSAAERRALRRHYESVDCRLQWRLLIEAVKARDLAASVRTFRSPPTALYLMARLAEQAWLRSVGRLQGGGEPRVKRADT